MGEKDLWLKLGLIVLLVGMCAWLLYPPGKRLKPGIDLGGGHSLLFEIDDTDDKSADLAERVMGVLKNRVDPQGNRNLVWRPIGRNRLEIQMPRPPKGQKNRREAYDNARARLRDTNITELQIRRALAFPADQRDAAFRKMVGPYASRKTLFDKLAEADEEYRQLSEQYGRLGPPATQPATRPATKPASRPETHVATKPATQAATQPTTQPDRSQLALRTDEAFVRREALIQDLLATNLDPRVLGDLLELGQGDKVRREAIRKLRNAHPDLAALIDEMRDAYDRYAADKGILDDPSDLIRLLRGAGVLEFRILATLDPGHRDMIDSSDRKYNEPVSKYVEQLAKFGPRPQSGDNFEWFRIAEREVESFTDPRLLYVVQEYAGAKYVLAHSTKDMGLLKDMDWSLRSARRGRDSVGRIAINFRLAGKGPRLFGALTSSNLKRSLCIFLDEQAISSANIKSAIYDSGQITGSFTEEYVAYLVNTLEAGALPARLKEVPLQEKSIGPALGETNRRMGQQAIIIAFIITIAFMAVYYMYTGFIADIALLMNLVITLGVMSFLQATFTLPGIAGLVLTLGMAVDANVLIYERIREELQRGVSVRMAVKLGYERAFSAILDSNVTTIITAVILGSLGSEEIKGFGLTLGIGLCTSMFTALFVTRQFLNIMVPRTLNTEETRRAWLGTGILVLAGAVILGLGYLFNAPGELGESALFGLGKFGAWIAATAVILMVCLWAFRLAYRGLGYQNANRLPMLRLFSEPTINWMRKYRVFWTASAMVIALGLVFEAHVDKKDYLDIEFIGGTSVQVEMNQDNQDITDEDLINKYIYNSDAGQNDPAHSVGWLNHAADVLDKAAVSAAGDDRFLLSTPQKLTTAQMQALLLPVFEKHVVRGGITGVEDGSGVAVTIKPPQAEKRLFDMGPEFEGDLEGGAISGNLRAKFADGGETLSPEATISIEEPDRRWLITDHAWRYPVIREGDALVAYKMRVLDQAGVEDLVRQAAEYVRSAANRLRGARVQLVEEETGKGETRTAFEIITTETRRTLVAEALLASMSEILEVTRSIEAALVKDLDRAPDGIFPITQDANVLPDVVGEDIGGVQEPIATFKGGVVLVFEGLSPPQTTGQVEQRLREMRLQPDFEGASWRDQVKVVGLEPADQGAPLTGNTPFRKVAIVVNDPRLPYVEGEENATWRSQIAETELNLAEAAFASTRSLQRVTQFAPQVAQEATTKAIIAILLSLLFIAGYIWVRFGSIQFGLAGIIALYHDVAVTLACVMACHHLHDTAIGKLLMLQDFKIDLAMIAAFLTIVGYSINDTIVIFDRIRENRGRLATVSESLINNSLNQTLSRTIITSLTTFMVVVVMYVAGGTGIHGFAFAMIVGTVSGTYSTLAIATPMLHHPRAMWVVTIILAGLTAIGLVSLVPLAPVRYTLMAIIAAVALLGLVRQLVAIREVPVRRPATA